MKLDTDMEENDELSFEEDFELDMDEIDDETAADMFMDEAEEDMTEDEEMLVSEDTEE